MKTKRCIIGEKYTEEIKELQSLGIECIPLKANANLDDEINSHADILCLKLNNEIVLADESVAGELSKKISDYKIISVNNIKSPYPKDIKLNTAIINNKVVCNSKHTAAEVLSYITDNNLQLINSKQGYTKCNLCIVTNNAVITEDEGLTCLLKNCQLDVLKITPGFVRLSEAHYGFIGGASGKINDETIYFSGNIEAHPDYKQIEAFLNKHNVKPIFNKNRNLSDFGGFIAI